MTRPIEPANGDDLVAAYLAGTSLKQLAEQAGYSRGAVGRYLAQRGVELRGRSAAEAVKWQQIKRDPQLVDRQLGKAWQAARERDAELEQRVCALYQDSLLSSRQIAALIGAKGANVRRILRLNGLGAARIAERRAFGAQGLYTRNNISQEERELLAAVRQAGLACIGQRRIGARNVDLALDECRVAVEIVRRHIGDSKNMARKRLKEIFDAGWRLLIVYDYMHKGIAHARVAEQLVAFAQLASRDPAARGQYGVIDGDAQPVALSGRYLRGFARVPGF